MLCGRFLSRLEELRLVWKEKKDVELGWELIVSAWICKIQVSDCLD
jgi:hypothetical protein